MTYTTVNEYSIGKNPYVIFDYKYSSRIVSLNRDYKKAVYSNDIDYVHKHKNDISDVSPMYITDVILLISTHGNYEMFKYLESTLSEMFGNHFYTYHLENIFPYLIKSCDVGDNLKIIVSLVKYYNVRIYRFSDKYDYEILHLYKRINDCIIHNIGCLL